MPAAPPTRTDRRWEEALDEHRVALAAFLDTAGRLDEEAWAQPWGPGKWTRAQVAEHLALSYEALLKEVRTGERMAPRLPRWKQNVLRWVLLPHILFHGSFPLRARSPREIRPGDAPGPRGPLLDRLRAAAERFEAELGRARRDGGGRVHSPYFGGVDAVRALRFCAVHLEHHRRQIAPRGG